MNEKTIRKLIKLVEESNIETLEVSSWGRRVRITGRVASSSNGNSSSPAIIETVVTPRPVQSTLPAAEPQALVEETGRLLEIKSPMVGTFYAAPAPDADPYVSLNEKITAGQVVCIVEAMKLMNEIESEYSGRIVKILAENAKPVEFGQALFLVEPA